MGIRPTFCQYLKVVPFDVVTSCRDVVCDSRCMAGTCDPLKMFSFSVMQPSLCFSNVGILAIPTRQLISLLLLISYLFFYSNLVVTCILNGHFWGCMSKHTKRQVKWFCFPTCVLLSCLSLQFVYYFLFSYDCQREIFFYDKQLFGINGHRCVDFIWN